MKLRLFLLLPLLGMTVSCGMKGALEKPSGAVPPPLYDRVFGAKQNPETGASIANDSEGDKP